MPTAKLLPHSYAAKIACYAVVLGGAVWAGLSCAQQPASAPVPVRSAPITTHSLAAIRPGVVKMTSPSEWSGLTPAQQQALKPLEPEWAHMSPVRRDKWMAIIRNYPKLTEAEQQKMHSRMVQWAALSNKERAQARLNYAEAKQLTVEERAAKWQAYQALSPQEKARLAAANTTPTPGAAVALKPVARNKLVPIPPQSTAAGKAGAKNHHPNRILLPHPASSKPQATAGKNSAPAPLAAPGAAVPGAAASAPAH